MPDKVVSHATAGPPRAEHLFPRFSLGPRLRGWRWRKFFPAALQQSNCFPLRLFWPARDAPNGRDRMSRRKCRCALFPDLARAHRDILGGRELADAHRAAGMKLGRGNADLRAQAKDAAVMHAGGHILEN